MQIEEIKIDKICPNEGQIDGLPANPRTIRAHAFEALKKNIQENPEMLGYRELIVYPFGKTYITVAGNMRLRACRELGFSTVPCKILPEETPVEKLRKYALLDNSQRGEWDWERLANEWDEEELSDMIDSSFSSYAAPPTEEKLESVKTNLDGTSFTLFFRNKEEDEAFVEFMEKLREKYKKIRPVSTLLLAWIAQIYADNREEDDSSRLNTLIKTYLDVEESKEVYK